MEQAQYVRGCLLGKFLCSDRVTGGARLSHLHWQGRPLAFAVAQPAARLRMPTTIPNPHDVRQCQIEANRPTAPD
jgi:hypothetical protein